MIIKEIKNHSLFEDFYIENGLELEKGNLRVMNPIYSIVAEIDGKRIGGATVSERFGVYVLDYIAVEKDFRRAGVASRLFNAITLRFNEFYLTAKVPEFFYSVGCIKTDEKSELLKECNGCDQYKNGCNPIVLKYSKGV